MSNDPGADDYQGGPVPRWPAAEIAAAWRRELPGVLTESIEIITPLWRVAKLLGDDRRRTLAVLGIDSSTLDLLSVIRRSGPPYELTTREITRRTLVTAGAVSQRVARAERAGLVVRAASSASRRAVAVRLTAAGHELIEAAVSQLLGHEAELVGALTAAERSALAGFLAKLEQSLTGVSAGSDSEGVAPR
jgi:DNA-binding MarR family transcriptional regulator